MVKKATYTSVQVMPTPKPRRHSKVESVPINATTVINSVKVVNGKPADRTGTMVRSGSNVSRFIMFNTALINHGKPKQIRMSNMFDPIVLQSAILARPARFTTSTLEISSGIEVPAASMVRPLIVSGIDIV